MVTNITPVPCFPNTATQLRVDDGHVTLGTGANFQWALLDAAGAIVAGPARSDLTAEQYAAWTGDDEFVVGAVAANVGVEVA